MWVIIVTVIERGGVVRNAKGIKVEELKQHMLSGAPLSDFSGGTVTDPDPKAIEDKCDILIPAAMEGVINVESQAYHRSGQWPCYSDGG